MRSLYDLSLRFKIPLWGSVLILVTAGSVGLALMFHAYDDLRQDVLISADSLGRTLSKTLFPVMLHDDVWHAYEIINAPFHSATPANPMQASALVLLNEQGRVYVSTQAYVYPVLADFGKLGPGYERLAKKLPGIRDHSSRNFELEGSNQIVVATPIAEGQERLGTLLIFYSKSVFVPRFLAIASRAGGITLLVLTILLPINWYWGRHLALPLMKLSSRMGEIGTHIPEPPDPAAYVHRDEVGELFVAFGKMVEALREGERMKDEMVRSQRLAAVGRLAVGIAHEVNNPLAGMLTAVDTLKQRPDIDPRVIKTVGLLERGLMQIRDTVQALLVDSRVVDRALAPNDIEDMRTLFQSHLLEKQLDLEWHSGLTQEIPLPATYVRQVVINLLLNAIQAAPGGGQIECRVEPEAEGLNIMVANTGALLTAEQMARLFEPFATAKEMGHGLGLWVTYQIVQQLRGSITAENGSDTVRFVVQLPLEHRP